MVVALLACAGVGCGRAPATLAADGVDKSAQTKSAPTEPAPAAPTPAVASSDGPGFPKPGWSKVVVEDKGTLCAVATYGEAYRARSIDKMHEQTLRAGSPFVFEAYSPACVNEACDQLPTLQCTVQREAMTLVVHTHYDAYHKDGTSCRDACRPFFASCETPELEAGKYSVRYGAKTYELKIPSSLRSPCFGVRR
jgi:hypothetical protein